MTLRHFVRAASLLTSAALLGACHVLEPMESAPSPGAQANVRLSEVGSANLAPILGAGTHAVRGTVLAMDSSTVLMSVVAVTDREGLENPWLGERVTLQRSYIVGYDRRELSPGRSTLVVAGIAAGMFVLARAASGGTDGLVSLVTFPKGR